MNDNEIIELFFQRSENALIEMKNKYESYYFSIGKNILASQEDVEECLNDMYMRLWQSIPPARPENLKQYASKIIRNLSFDRYRKLSAQKRGGLEMTAILHELEACIPRGKSLEEEVEEGFISDYMNHYLMTIQKHKRIIFIKRYYYSYKVKDIALAFNMSESKVKSILFRIRKEMKKQLMKEGIL